MEQWLITNALEITVLVIGFLWAFIKMDRDTKETKKWRVEMKDAIGVIADDLDRHITDDSPHRSCPAHLVKIEDALTRMDRIQSDIRELRGEIAEYNRGVMNLAMSVNNTKKT
jgi:hypothetical protein